MTVLHAAVGFHQLIQSVLLPVDHRPEGTVRCQPAGPVSPRDVLFLFGGVSALGLLAAFPVDPMVLAAVLLVWLLGILYNWRLNQRRAAGKPAGQL